MTIQNKTEFRNYMLGVAKELQEHIDFESMTEDGEEVIDLYNKLYWFIDNDCEPVPSTPNFNRTSFEYKGKTYPAVELFDVETSDGCHIDYAVFADLDFMDAEGDCLEYRMLDDRIYGYLSKDLIQNGTEYEIRKHIKENIG